MEKWLSAICKGLSDAAGSFVLIGQLALNIYDDEKAIQHDAKLQKLIINGQI
jgi:hypothetical protein